MKKIRVSYVIMGIFALLIGIVALWLYCDFLFTEFSIRVKSLTDFELLSFGGVREKIRSKVELYYTSTSEYSFDELEDIWGYDLVQNKFSFAFILVCASLLIDVLSLFTKRQKSACVFYKLSLISSTLMIFSIYLMQFLMGKGKLLKIVEYYVNHVIIIWLVFLSISWLTLIIGAICTKSKKNPFEPTAFLVFKLWFWIGVETSYVLFALSYLEKSDMPLIYPTYMILYAMGLLPVYVLICSTMLFSGSSYNYEQTREILSRK